jgi:putative transposase
MYIGSESRFHRVLRAANQLPHRSKAQARQWVHQFVGWYNGEHRHSRLKFVTPNQRHQRQDAAILARRNAVYEQAKRQHPERWSGRTRNWNPVGAVSLNPSGGEVDADTADPRAAA